MWNYLQNISLVESNIDHNKRMMNFCRILGAISWGIIAGIIGCDGVLGKFIFFETLNYFIITQYLI